MIGDAPLGLMGDKPKVIQSPEQQQGPAPANPFNNPLVNAGAPGVPVPQGTQPPQNLIDPTTARPMPKPNGGALGAYGTRQQSVPISGEGGAFDQNNPWYNGNPYLSGYMFNESIPLAERQAYVRNWAQGSGAMGGGGMQSVAGPGFVGPDGRPHQNITYQPGSNVDPGLSQYMQGSVDMYGRPTTPPIVASDRNVGPQNQMFDFNNYLGEMMAPLTEDQLAGKTPLTPQQQLGQDLRMRRAAQLGIDPSELMGQNPLTGLPENMRERARTGGGSKVGVEGKPSASTIELGSTREELNNPRGFSQSDPYGERARYNNNFASSLGNIFGKGGA